MLWLQRTVAKDATIEGIGLHSGQPARMTLQPAAVNTGLVFVVPGPGGETRIPALVEHAAPAADLVRATTLSHDGVTVHTVEHVLAALYGLGVTNCVIRLEGGEPPVTGCASSLPYVEMLDRAGLRDQGLPATYHRITRPVSLSLGEARLEAVPADDFRISFEIDYDEPLIG